MKQIVAVLLLITLAGCNRRGSDYEKLQKTMEEARRDMQHIDLSAKLTTRCIPAVKDNEELKRICEQVMKKVGQGDLRAAFDEIAKYSIVPKAEIDNAYTASKRQLDLVGGRYGRSIGYEYVGVQQISNSLVKYIYVAKCENHALVWHFVFYKPNDKWTLNNFSWDDRPQDIQY